eukprot:g4941.t1
MRDTCNRPRPPIGGVAARLAWALLAFAIVGSANSAWFGPKEFRRHTTVDITLRVNKPHKDALDRLARKHKIGWNFADHKKVPMADLNMLHDKLKQLDAGKSQEEVFGRMSHGGSAPAPAPVLRPDPRHDVLGLEGDAPVVSTLHRSTAPMPTPAPSPGPNTTQARELQKLRDWAAKHGLQTCLEGPYVLDLRSDFAGPEGIGSGMAWYGESIVTADALDAHWVSKMYNGHGPEWLHPDHLAGSFFGFIDSRNKGKECGMDSLTRYQRVKRPYLPLHFIRQTKFVAQGMWNQSGMCNPKLSHRELVAAHRAGLLAAAGPSLRASDPSQWVVVYGRSDGDRAGDIYKHPLPDRCLFNERFRGRYLKARAARLGSTVNSSGTPVQWTPRRPAGEYWIVVHFRWGDTKKWVKSVDRAGFRSSCSLGSFAKITAARVQYLRRQNLTQTIRVHLITEGNASEFTKFVKLVPDATLHLAHHPFAWQRAYDLITQSQELLRGSSKFTKPAARLCDRCRERCCRNGREQYCAHDTNSYDGPAKHKVDKNGRSIPHR